jgi:hypothetical protein
MTIVYIKNGKEATAEECLIQQKFFYSSSLEWLGNAAYPIYDKDYIRTLIMQGFLKDKLFEKLHFFSNEETDGQTLNIEVMQHMFFPNHSIQDIPYEWAEWDKLYREAVIILKEWNEAEKVKQEQENKHEEHDDVMSYMNAVFDANKTVAIPTCEIFNRAAIIPRLAISIEDSEVVLRRNGEVKDADKLRKIMDKQERAEDKARKRKRKV